MLDTIFIEPSEQAKYTVIWFHGLGADGTDFAPIAGELHKLTGLPVRFIFPHAPMRPITLNNGHVMRAWYDIMGLSTEAEEDREGLDAVATMVDKMIQEQIDAGIPAENIFLGGFSQGGAVSLYTGLRYPKKLAGIIGLSTYLPFRHHLYDEKHPENHDVPIFLAHGIKDPILPLEWAKISRDFLQKSHHRISFHTYRMAHQVCEAEIAALGAWMKELLQG